MHTFDAQQVEGRKATGKPERAREMQADSGPSIIDHFQYAGLHEPASSEAYGILHALSSEALLLSSHYISETMAASRDQPSSCYVQLRNLLAGPETSGVKYKSGTAAAFIVGAGPAAREAVPALHQLGLSPIFILHYDSGEM